jgi:hypothetical protein
MDFTVFAIFGTIIKKNSIFILYKEVSIAMFVIIALSKHIKSDITIRDRVKRGFVFYNEIFCIEHSILSGV